MASLDRHRNAGLEIVYVLRGHLLWQTEGRAEAVPRGSVFFTLPGREHGSAEEFEPGHEWCYVILGPASRPGGCLPAALGFDPSDSRAIERALRRAKRHAWPATAGMRWLLPELVRELEQPGPHHRAKVTGLARAAVVELARSLASGRDGADRDPDGDAATGFHDLIERIVRAPQEPWTLASMAAACSLGRTRFSARFVELTGDTPRRFVNRMRVRRACKLLRESEWPVTRVAMECGFETSQYFAAVFKKYTGGLGAREYRRLKVLGHR